MHVQGFSTKQLQAAWLSPSTPTHPTPPHLTPPTPATTRERATLEARLREQLGSATTRAGEAESDARALREQKYGLDARVSELSHKLGAAEGSNRCLWGGAGEGGGRVQRRRAVGRGCW